MRNTDNRCGRRPSLQHAFTLIEVLVVVAIIALLIAILTPSLRKARAQARTSLCLGNLKQIGNGMIMYKGDHRGWLPVGPADRIMYVDSTGYHEEPGPGRKPFVYQNCEWGGKRSKYNHDWRDPPREEMAKRPLTNYFYRGTSLDSPVPVFECPSDTGFDRQTWPSRPADLMDAKAYDICGNSYWINPWDKPTQGDHKRIRDTSRLILAEDAPLHFSITQGRQLAGWHDRFSKHNTLFLDFHAASLYVDPRTYDPGLNAQVASRQFRGPGWFFVNYFEIMDYYK